MPNAAKKTRGLTSITEAGKIDAMRPSRPNLPQEQRSEANRPTGSGVGKHRGDRRDMNKAYTGNQRHAARGNTPRVNVATRKD